MEEMTEIRCKKCKRLLFKYRDEDDSKNREALYEGPYRRAYQVGAIEIKCPKCGYKNNIK